MATTTTITEIEYCQTTAGDPSSRVAPRNDNTSSISASTETDEKTQDSFADKPIDANKWGKNDAYDSGPDGGLTGWLVVVGSFLGYFTSFGTETAWGTCWVHPKDKQKINHSCLGILQAYFEENVFHDVPDAQFKLSFAGTLIGLLPQLMGLVTQLLVAKFGVRKTLIAGVLFIVLGLEAASFTTEIWHLHLTQGLLFGLGAAFFYAAAINVPAQWFNQRRGLALGTVTCGSGIGGVILPFIITDLISRVGIAWTYRILGFIYLGLNSITCVLVKEKYPSNKKIKSADDGEEQPSVSRPKLTEIFDFSIFKDSVFLWWMIASVISTSANFVPFFFVPTYATYHGLSSADGTVFMAVLAASNCVGRFGIGFISDRIGRLNAHILSTFIAAIAGFGIWSVATTYDTIMGFAVVYGLFCSSFYCLVPAITATVVGIEKFPTALSFMMLTNSISILGPNIASGIESSVNSEPYFSYKMFTGASFGVGGFLLVCLKLKMTGGKLFVKI